MKKHLFGITIFISLLFSTTTNAQTGIEWQGCYGSSLSENLYDACKTPDGGYIMVGDTPLDTVIGIWPTNYGKNDYGVIRIDSVGNVVWVKTYGGNSFENALSIIKGNRPNRYYICGGTSSEGSTNYHSALSTQDAWLIAIDSNGTLLWERCYGGYSDESFNTLVQLADSNIIYGIGETSSPSNSGDVSLNYLNTITGWICKIDANTGMLINEKSFGGTGNDFLYYSAKLTNSSFMVHGRTSSKDHDVWNYYGLNNEGGWLLNIDTSLNIVWQKSIGSTGGGLSYDVIKTHDGGVAVLGATTNRPGDTSCFNFYVDTLVNGTRKEEAFIIKYDSSGNELWQQHYSAPLDRVTPNSPLVQMTDGGYAFGTEVSKWNGFALWPYNHGSVIFKTDSLGNFVSASRYGNGGYMPLDMAQLLCTNDNQLVVFSSTTPDPSISCSNQYNGDRFWYVIRIGHQLAIEDINQKQLQIKVFPNPSNGVFNIELENTKSIKQITIYNTLGQIVKTVSTKQAIKTYKLDLSGNSKGLYFIGIEVDNTMVFKKVVLE